MSYMRRQSCETLLRKAQGRETMEEGKKTPAPGSPGRA